MNKIIISLLAGLFLAGGVYAYIQKEGFKFTGTTICYAFMQAVGMVNDHTTDCFRYDKIKMTYPVI